VGTAKGAEYGILIKGGEALEKSHKITTVAFDKTGTLTKGKPAVTDIVPVGEERDKKKILEIAAIIEKGSEHPLATAIVKEAESQGIKVSSPKNFKALSGMGAYGEYKQAQIFIGNQLLMEKNGIDTSNLEADAKRLRKEAKTVIFLARDKKVIGIFALADTLKEYAKSAIRELKKRKKKR